MTKLPFPLPRKICVFAGRSPLSRPRPLLARRREVLTGASSPPTIADPGNGSGLPRSCAAAGIRLVASPHAVHPFWRLRLPLAPLLSALGRTQRSAARWGPSFWWGAAISAAISIDLNAERSLPHSDGLLNLGASRCPPPQFTIPVKSYSVRFTPLLFASGYCAAARMPPRLPIADAAAPPASAPPRLPPAS